MARRGEIVIKFTLTGTKDVAGKIDKIADALDRIAKSDKKINQVSQSIDKLANAATRLAAASGNVQKLAQALSGITTGQINQANRALGNLSGTITGILSRGIVGLGNTISTVGVSVGRFSNMLANQFLGMSRDIIVAMRGAALMVGQFGSAIRMAGQAFQNVGTTLSIFVALPISRMLQGGISTLVDFDDALVKVQKTTGLADKELGRMSNTIDLLSRRFSSLDKASSESINSISASVETLSGRLLEMAKYAPTPLNDLAALAEEAGRLGIQSQDKIMEFVRAAEMIGTATDIASEEAIQAFSRLAQATGLLRDEFGELREDAGENIMRIANTVNMLENTTMGSASQIVAAMERMIASAAEFDIPAQQIAAFAATLIETGLNAEVAGTAFDRVVTYMTANSDKLAEAMGTSVDKIMQSLDRDLVGTLLQVIESFGDMESSAEAAALAYEIFGVRGRRGIALLTEAYGRLKDNISNANMEFSTGTSLVDEYYKALDSTKNQWKIFQNNINVAAVLLGRSFLPTLNRIAQIGVAVVQILTEQWDKLSARTKVLAVAFAVLAVIVPPVMLAFGSIIFGVGMIISMFGTLATGIVSLVGVITNLFVPAVGAIALGLLVVPDLVSNLMQSLFGFFESLQNEARGWGEGLMKNLATGIINSAMFVINAVYRVAEAIARFFRSASPPEVGPLSTIDQWGAALMDNLLLGFSLADFGVLDSVGRYIRGFFDALDLGGDNIGQSIMAVREQVKSLIDVFNETGQISQDILSSIGDAFGDVGFAIEDLLSLQLRYQQELETLRELESQLDNLRRAREDINDTYREEVAAIAASGAPAAERVRAFREARSERDDDLAIIDDEIDATENVIDIQKDVVGSLKEQVDWQTALLDQLLEEARLFEDIEEKAGRTGRSIKDALSGLEGIDLGAGFDWDSITGGAAGVAETIGDIELGIESMRDKFDEARLAVETFWAALTGQAPPEGALAPAVFRGPYDMEGVETPTFQSEFLQNAWELGEQIRKKWLEIISVIEEVKTKFGEAMGAYEDFVSGLQSENMSHLPEPVQELAKRLAELDPIKLLLLTTIGLKALGIFFRLTGVIGMLGGPLGWIIKQFGRLVGFIGGIKIASIVGGFETLALWAMEAGGAISGIAAALGTTVAGLLGLVGAIGLLIAAIVIFGPEAWENLKGIASNIWIILQEIWSRIEEWAAGIPDTLRNAWGGLGQIAENAWNGVVEFFGGIGETLGAVFTEQIPQAIQNIGTALGNTTSTVIGWIQEHITDPIGNFFTETIPTAFGNIVTGAQGAISDIETGLAGVLETIRGWLEERFRGLLTAMGLDPDEMFARWGQIWADIQEIAETAWGIFITWLTGIGQDIIDGVTTAYNEAAGFLEQGWTIITDALDSTWGAIVEYVITPLAALPGQIWEAITGAWSTLLEIGAGFIGMIVTGVENAWNGIVEVFAPLVQTIVDFVTETWNDIVEIGTMLIDAIVEGVETAWGAVTSFFAGGWELISSAIMESWDALVDVGAQIIAAILLGINTFIASIVETFGPLITDIIGAVTEFITDLYDLGVSIVQGIIDGILGMAGDLVEGATSAIEDMIDAVQRWLGISSPSKVFIAIGEDIVQGIIDGIKNLWSSLVTKGEELIGEFTSWFTDIYDNVTGKVQELIDEVLRVFNEWKDGGIATFLASLGTTFETAFETIKTTISGLLKGGLNFMLDNAESAINGIISGINEIGNLIMRLPGAEALLGGIFPLPLVDLPSLAAGGIVMSPTVARVGDVSGGEAIVPLKKLPPIIAEAQGMSPAQQTIYIRIDRVNANDESDINELVDRISRELGRRAKHGSRLGVNVTMG